MEELFYKEELNFEKNTKKNIKYLKEKGLFYWNYYVYF